MESIGRDNIKVTNYVAEEQLKDNNRFRPVIVIGFILVILFLTIAYASLAINYGVKIHEPRRTTTEVKGDDIIVTTTTPPGSTTPTTGPVITRTRTTSTRLTTITSTVLGWDIHFENIDVYAGSVTATTPAYIKNKTDVYYDIVLRQPGEFYKFSVDMVNAGGRNAKVFDVLEKQLDPNQRRFLKVTYTYLNGNEIKVGDELPAHAVSTMVVDIRFRDDITAANLPDGETEIHMAYELVYVEK